VFKLKELRAKYNISSSPKKNRLTLEAKKTLDAEALLLSSSRSARAMRPTSADNARNNLELKLDNMHRTVERESELRDQFKDNARNAERELADLKDRWLSSSQPLC
jgi:hypothetical protein